MTSIKDVAKLAGVSVMTVSRALNQTGSVSPATTRRIRQAAKQLGYYPNLTARSLKSRHSSLLGLLLPDIGNPVFAMLAKCIEAEAERYEFSVILGTTWEDPNRENSHIEHMISRQMEGLLISQVSEGSNRLLERCPIPVLTLDREFVPASFPHVGMGNRQAGRIAARHLLSLGHRHFACMPGPRHIGIFVERLEGFMEEIARAGLASPVVMGVTNIEEINPGMAVVKELLEACPDRPLALFCANDFTALGAMQAILGCGLAVPGDVSIVGVDDIPACVLTTPTLTTVRQPTPAIAAAGVGMMMALLRGEKPRETRVVVEPELIARGSTKRYAASAGPRRAAAGRRVSI